MSPDDISAAVREAFDELKATTGLTDRDFSDRDKMALHAMFLEGAKFGTRCASELAKDVLKVPVRNVHRIGSEG